MYSIFHNVHGGPACLIEPGMLCGHFSRKFYPAPSWGSHWHAASVGTGRLLGAGTASLGVLRPLDVCPPSLGLHLELCRASPLTISVVSRLLHVPPDGRKASRRKDSFFWVSAVYHRGLYFRASGSPPSAWTCTFHSSD